MRPLLCTTRDTRGTLRFLAAPATTSPDQSMDYQTLTEQLWQSLTDALSHPHPWRTPVLASVDQNGLPQARTVVLREVARASNQLCFYTDKRSPKVAQLRARPAVALLFWNPQTQWQLRITAKADVIERGERLEKVWQTLVSKGRTADYLAPGAPGSPPECTDQPPSSHQLALIVCDLVEMDWLHLDRNGHRRARLRDGELHWLTP